MARSAPKRSRPAVKTVRRATRRGHSRGMAWPHARRFLAQLALVYGIAVAVAAPSAAASSPRPVITSISASDDPLRAGAVEVDVYATARSVTICAGRHTICKGATKGHGEDWHASFTGAGIHTATLLHPSSVAYRVIARNGSGSAVARSGTATVLP